MAQHPREHVVRKQADIVAEHAEDESVDEVRTTCGSCPRARNAWATDANDAAARSVSDCRVSSWVSPGRRRSGSENAHFSRSHVDASTRSSSSNSCVRLTLFVQLVRIRTAPCPTRSAAAVLQRQRVLPELVEGGVEVRATLLVLPGEVVAPPDVGPAVTAGVLPRTALEAVRLARRVRLDRRRLTQQMAQVDEVLLRCRTLFQRRGPPPGCRALVAVDAADGELRATASVSKMSGSLPRGRHRRNPADIGAWLVDPCVDRVVQVVDPRTSSTSSFPLGSGRD